MSVMLLGLDLYQEVYNKMCKCAYSKTSEVGQIHGTDVMEYEVRNFIATLYEMNEMSHSNRYHQPIDEERIKQLKDVIEGWRYNDIKKKPCDIYQFLKHLQCIRYQIEDYEIKDKDYWYMEHEKAMEWLLSLIDSIMYAIVSLHPQWQKAKWGSAS